MTKGLNKARLKNQHHDYNPVPKKRRTLVIFVMASFLLSSGDTNSSLACWRIKPTVSCQDSDLGITSALSSSSPYSMAWSLHCSPGGRSFLEQYGKAHCPAFMRPASVFLCIIVDFIISLLLFIQLIHPIY